MPPRYRCRYRTPATYGAPGIHHQQDVTEVAPLPRRDVAASFAAPLTASLPGGGSRKNLYRRLVRRQRGFCEAGATLDLNAAFLQLA